MRLVTLIFTVISLAAQAQFDGPGGQSGSMSIDKDHASITAWATSADLQVGPSQNSDSSLGYPTLGTVASALGAFDGDLVSLGDGGTITLSFARPIQNGDGYDFAVFENGFNVGLSYYLELAFVEVSENGTDFVRFPNESVIDTGFQTDNFGYTDPTKIYNLAGKHQAPYGTLFDLEEVGMNEVNYVRLIDVVGSVNDSFGSRDSKGRIINDPWPTPFASSGFDLDAVAVVNGTLLKREEHVLTGVNIYPTRANVYQYITVESPQDARVELMDMQGKIILETIERQFSVDQLGIYLVRVIQADKVYTQKIVVE